MFLCYWISRNLCKMGYSGKKIHPHPHPSHPDFPASKTNPPAWIFNPETPPDRISITLHFKSVVANTQFCFMQIYKKN